MNPLAIIGSEFKALAKIVNHGGIFATIGAQNYSGGVMASFDGNGWVRPGQSNQAPDFNALMADPLQNGVVAACVGAIAKATRSAPLVLEQRVKGAWETVDEHECLNPLRSPNEDHSSADIWALTSGFKATHGQAFWILLPDKTGNAREIHVWHPRRVTVLGDENHFISGYRVEKEQGGFIQPDFDKQQVIHFRDAPDFNNPRIGWNSIQTARSQITGDNLSSTYTTSLLFNSGMVSLLISLKEGAATGQVTPDQFQAKLDDIKRSTLERAGKVHGFNLPLEVHKLAYSLDEMKIDGLIEYYERRVCSIMGVSQRVCGLGADPTYNNLSEALNDFWERRIIPDRDADAETLNRQWLPLWGMDAAEWRFRFDYSNIPALQENKDELHKRVRDDFEKGIVDKKQARALLGYAIQDGTLEDEYQGVFTPFPQGKQSGDQPMPNDNEKPEVKALDEPQPLTPWTDAELDAMTEVDEDTVKRTLASRGPEMRNVLEAKPK